MAVKVSSFFSHSSRDPYDEVSWKWYEAHGGPQDQVEFPTFWSGIARKITTTKYFRKAGIRENSLRQLLSRVTKVVAHEGLRQRVFASSQDAAVFERELRSLLLHQKASFNSPVWFNCGLSSVYGIEGMQTELYAWDSDTQKVRAFEHSYTRPQVSACFIQSVLASERAMQTHAELEEKIFRFGSGSGSNFSALKNSDLFRWLNILDKNAARIKSGGVARRAAKMVCLDIDHPQVLEFIRWKKNEEQKLRGIGNAGGDGSFESQAFESLSGQNSNNSVRVGEDFLQILAKKESWTLREGVTMPAERLWEEICEAAWACGDPGLQFADTIEKWNMVKLSGKIEASNPCAEFVFLNETACNLASLNLMGFYQKPGKFDFESFEKAARIFLIAQEILVDYASYPSREIALNSHRFRPLGLGYTNLAGLFMRLGIPYGSEISLRWTAEITARLHLVALETSHELARSRGAFDAFAENFGSVQEVFGLHFEEWKKFAKGSSQDEKLSKRWTILKKQIGDQGLRNSQVTLLAPTGTISLMMDCETTGIEPEYSLIRSKILSGGGTLQWINAGVGPSLQELGYDSKEINLILEHLKTEGHLEGAPGLKASHLPIFDTSLSGGNGHRSVSWKPQVELVAVAQKFLSGAISKTVNLPSNSTPREISEIYPTAAAKGLKSISVYREGSKTSQPLTPLRKR
ncbi:MAG: adenosylcobalamin-dependent ribonucleoside-diphosphate reductase [Bdellovibrionales bacterium]|nr:adenosylcobalamin-dependent ribonucleoside-diphosphate reductase [Bdellovibrionales bacterium]